MDENNPHKTAKSRKGKITKPADWLMETVLPQLGWMPSKVLDFGAGISSDDEHWNNHPSVQLARGYDSHPHKGFEHRAQRPTSNDFDLVTMIYVLNVIDSEAERIEALQDANLCLASGGYLWVATRNRYDIKGGAKRGNWQVTTHGSYISSASKGTTQFGMDNQDIIDLVAKAGLNNLTPCTLKGKPNYNTGFALFKKF